MRRWIDPRTNPKPPYTGSQRPIARAATELRELVAACKEGRLYDVEAWVAAGHPLQLDPQCRNRHGRPVSALRAAIAVGTFDMVRLLLCNGYRIELEVRSPLNDALDARRWDLLDLLLDWGADPAAADVWRILESYERGVFERFWNAGVDLTARDAFAQTLASATRNRPLYGFARAYRERDARIQRALDVGLGAAIEKRNDKAVRLCLWAGADARSRVGDFGDGAADDPDGMTALERAVAAGVPEYLRELGFDPVRDAVEPLYQYARNGSTLRALVAIRPPKDWHAIVERLLLNLAFSVRFSIPMTSLWEIESVFTMGGRLGPLDHHGKREVRRLLLSLNESDAQRLFRLLRNPNHMDRDSFLELVAHEKLVARYGTWGRRAGIDKEFLSALAMRPGIPGAARRMAKARLAPVRDVVMYTEVMDAGGSRMLSRKELYERVWSEALGKLAQSFGLSDNGLRKRCRAMQVPTPPRGYWQRVARGQRARRMPLPPAGDFR